MSVSNQSNVTECDSLLKQDIPNDLERDLHNDLKRDLIGGPKRDLPGDLKQDVPSDLKQDIPSDLTRDVPSDLKQDVPSDLKQDVPPELKKEHYHTSNQSIHSAHTNGHTANPDYILNIGDTNEMVPFLDQSVRNIFLRKVYGILTLQLVAVLGMMVIMFYTPSVKNYVLKRPVFLITACVILAALLIFLFFVKKLRRRNPWNIIFLIVLTICLGYFMGTVTVAAESEDVLKAMVTKIVIVVSLIIFTLQTKIKLTLISGAVLILAMGLLSFAILASVFRVNILYNFLAVLGSVIFCFYVLADTQLIMDEEHPVKISPEEAIFATLNLYFDFIYVIRCVGFFFTICCPYTYLICLFMCEGTSQ